MITFSQKYLRQALGGLRVLKVSKQTITPLNCVLVRGARDTVVFEATTLDEHLRFEGRGETDISATQLVPYDLLHDALKSADPDSVLTLEPDALNYVTGGAKLSVPLPEHNVADFPPTPLIEGDPIPLPAGVIGSMAEAQGCASTDASRYILNAVLLSPHDVVATDGRQLYRRNGLELALPKEGVMFPLSGVPGVLQPDHPAELWVGDLRKSPKAAITQGPWKWTTKLVDGNYPNFKQVLPRIEDYGTVIRIAEADATRLLSVLPRLPGYKESSSPVRLSITDNGAELSPPARLPQVKVALDRSEITGPRPVRIQFNAGFFLGALKRGFRELHLRDDVSPAFMKDESRINLWMPIRLDGGPVPSAPAPVEASPAPAQPEASPVPVQSSTNDTQPQPETTMVAMKSTPAPEPVPAAPTAEGPAPAARIVTPEPVSEISPLDTLQRAKDLLRDVQAALTEASNAIRDLAREKRAVERDLESLKRNIRVLRAVEV